MPLTSAQLFASLNTPGQTVDLKGETVTGSDVDFTSPGVTVENAVFVGQTQMFNADHVQFKNCTFTAGTSTTDHGLLRMLGGTGWIVTGCRFVGGVVASQLGVGLNSRVKASVPMNWVIEDCTFEPNDGQWGQYPQTHHIYVLTDPGTNMNGIIDRCVLHGSPFGAGLKLGGTGNQPHSEGTKGVLVTDCHINGKLDVAGRCLTVLTQGEKTDVTVRHCTLTGTDGVIPFVQGMDGARCRFEQMDLPQGVTEHATWFVAYFFKQEKKVTVPPGQKPPNIGKLSWVV